MCPRDSKMPSRFEKCRKHRRDYLVWKNEMSWFTPHPIDLLRWPCCPGSWAPVRPRCWSTFWPTSRASSAPYGWIAVACCGVVALHHKAYNLVLSLSLRSPNSNRRHRGSQVSRRKMYMFYAPNFSTSEYPWNIPHVFVENKVMESGKFLCLPIDGLKCFPILSWQIKTPWNTIWSTDHPRAKNMGHRSTISLPMFQKKNENFNSSITNKNGFSKSLFLESLFSETWRTRKRRHIIFLGLYDWSGRPSEPCMLGFTQVLVNDMAEVNIDSAMVGALEFEKTNGHTTLLVFDT